MKFLNFCFIFILSLLDVKFNYFGANSPKYNSSINDSRVINLFNNINNNQDDLFLNNFSANYFYNLRGHFPLNTNGTCSFVSLSMLLSFYDTYLNDSFVNEHFEDNSHFTQIVNSSGEEMIPLDVESPGILYGIPNNYSNNSFYFLSYVLPNRNNFLQEYLIYKAYELYGMSLFETSDKPYGLSLFQEAGLLMDYLANDRNILPSGIAVNSLNGTFRDLTEEILNNILLGKPTILNIHSSIIGNHSVIAYDYNPDTLEIYVHTGLKNQNGDSLYHVSLSQLGVTSIDSGIALELNEFDHSHSPHYFSSSGNSLCACSCLGYGEINVSSSIYRNETPLISFRHIFENDWLIFYEMYYMVSYFNGENLLIDEEYNISYPFHYIDNHIWDRIVRSNLSSTIKIEIQAYFFDEEEVHTFSLGNIQIEEPDDYNDCKSIKYNNYGYPNDIFPDIRPSMRWTSHVGDGINFQTKRFRAASIKDGYVTLSCIGDSCDSSYIEYRFDVPISFINLQLYIPFQRILSNYSFFYKVEVKNEEDSEWIECPVSNLNYFYFANYSLSHPKWVELSLGDQYTNLRITGKSTGANLSGEDKGFLYIGDMFLFETLPLNGCEIEYNQNEWNDNLVRNLNNCYSYAINYMFYNEYDLKPGFLTGALSCENLTEDEYYDKQMFENMVIHDGYNFLSFDFMRVGKYEKCKPGYYKVALVFGYYSNESGTFRDFHWYRQNAVIGTWSHKRGFTYVFDFDASDKKIYDPEFCDRNYLDDDNLIYNEFVGFYQIKLLR